MGGLKRNLCYKKSRVLASARMPPLVASQYSMFIVDKMVCNAASDLKNINLWRMAGPSRMALPISGGTTNQRNPARHMSCQL